MGFFDENPDVLSGGGGRYVNEDEKNVLIEQGVPFDITAVELTTHPKYGERYEASVVIPAGALSNEEDDDRLISFPYNTVESRDRMLAAMVKWFEDPSNPPERVKLERVGRSILIRPAS